MRIFISVDLEGISGVTAWEHVLPGNKDYPYFRHMMTQDVNAAIRGAAEGGADEFTVRDGHAAATNLLIDELDERANASLGMPALYSMMHDIDHGFDAAFFIGYHARMGTSQALLDHTWSSKHVSNIYVNDMPVGEIGLNALMCSHYQIPVMQLSGDMAACEEATEWIKGIETAVVKQAIGRSSARCLSLKNARQNIYEAAKRGIARLQQGDSVSFPDITYPAKISIEFNNSRMADYAAMMKDTVRLDGKKVQVISADMPEAYRDITVLCRLAGSD